MRRGDKMLLMNGDTKVLQFSLDDVTLKVLNNDFLPYQLKDWLIDTDFSTAESRKCSMHQFDIFKDFLLGRLLSFSRENAKAILNSISATQSSSISEKIKIVIACRALSMTDNFWVKDEDEDITFKEVNLRHIKLKDAAFSIAIQGKVISATNTVLDPELVTSGMFAKTWYRGEKGIQLWKTDRTQDKINTKAEVTVSDFLDEIKVEHVKYWFQGQDEILMVGCDCIASDDISLITAQSVKDWCFHQNIDFINWIEDNYLLSFAQMCVIDYVIANTDRHWENWGFLVDNNTNQIINMAPLYDHNQALIADYVGTEVDDLIYEPLNVIMLEAAYRYAPCSKLVINHFPTEGCKRRYFKLCSLYNKEVSMKL